MEVVRDKTTTASSPAVLYRKLRRNGYPYWDSITVAPAQTLTDKEYQIMRNAHGGTA